MASAERNGGIGAGVGDVSGDLIFHAFSTSEFAQPTQSRLVSTQNRGDKDDNEETIETAISVGSPLVDRHEHKTSSKGTDLNESDPRGPGLKRTMTPWSDEETILEKESCIDLMLKVPCCGCSSYLDDRGAGVGQPKSLPQSKCASKYQCTRPDFDDDGNMILETFVNSLSPANKRCRLATDFYRPSPESIGVRLSTTSPTLNKTQRVVRRTAKTITPFKKDTVKRPARSTNNQKKNSNKKEAPKKVAALKVASKPGPEPNRGSALAAKDVKKTMEYIQLKHELSLAQTKIGYLEAMNAHLAAQNQWFMQGTFGEGPGTWPAGTGRAGPSIPNERTGRIEIPGEQASRRYTPPFHAGAANLS